MSDKKELNYQKSLRNFIFIYKFLFFGLAAAMIFVAFFYKLQYGTRTGSFILAGILVILGLWTLLNSFTHAEYDHQSLTITKFFKTKEIIFANITALKDTGKAIEFYEGNKRVLKLSGLTYEVSDLADLVNYVERRDLKLEDVEKETALSRFFGSEKMSVVLLALGIFNIVYLGSTFILSTSNIGLFYVVSLMLPLFSFVFYLYLLLSGEVETLLGYRILFFMNLFVPALALAIVLAKTYSFASPKSLFIFGLCLFIFVDIFYRLLSSLVSAGTDAFMKAYLFLLIPLLLVIINISVPPIKTTTTTETITEITTQTSKVMLGYTVISEDADGNSTHFNVPTNNITEYAVGQEVTIKRMTGPFALDYIVVEK